MKKKGECIATVVAKYFHRLVLLFFYVGQFNRVKQANKEKLFFALLKFSPLTIFFF